MALKKPSDLFNLKKTAPKEDFVVDTSSNSAINFSETFDRFKGNINKIEEISNTLSGLQQNLADKVSKSELETAILSQLMIMEENFKKIQSQVKGLNKEDLQEYSTYINGLTEYVGVIDEQLNSFNNELQEAKISVNKNILAVRADVTIVEKHLRDTTNNLSVVEDYIKDNHIELITLREELFADIHKLSVDTIWENIERIENKIDYITEVYSKIEPDSIIKEVISEGGFAEPSSIKNRDPLTPLNKNFVTLDQLQQHYRLFLNRIQQQVSTIGGGGETRLKYLDDIVGIATNPTVYDGKYLKYNDSIKKFEFVDVSSSTIIDVAKYATTSGIATYATNAGIATYATTAGIATYATTAGIATYATTAGIATYATSSGIATYATSSGVSTYATTSGIATYATTSGIATYATTSGIATYATTSGIATYATNAGISSTLTATASVNTTGIITATSFSGSGASLTSLNASNLSSGIVPSARITASSGDFTVGQNLYVTGSLSVGGTSVILNAATLQITDKDIVLGITTDANNNDVSTDNTANHGGIAIASTVGSPIINIPIQVGVNSNPSTYKQFMWIKQGNYSGMGTDAWVSNYAISIGNTSTVANGSRLTVGTGFTVYDNRLDVSNIYSTGIITATTFVGNLTGTATNVIGGIGSLTSLTVSGLSTFTNGPVLIGTGTSTGTANQPLQVNGKAYFANSVGINSTNPTASLDVIGVMKIGTATTYTTIGNDLGRNIELGVGATTLDTYIDFGGSATYTDYAVRLQRIAGDNGNFNIVNRGTGNLRLVTQDAGPIDFVTNNTLRHRINSDGIFLVGAGTSTGTANQPLQVTGGAYVSGNLGIGETNPSTLKLSVSGGDVRFYTSGQGDVTISHSSLVSSIKAQSSVQLALGANNAEAIRINTSNQVGIGTITPLQPFQIGSGASVVVVDNIGELGIGTTNPTSKLHVVGNALVTGIVTATTFVGNLTGSATTATNVIGGIGSLTSLTVSGLSTFTNGPVLIGAATSTGTASQPLQVTGGAYVSGSVGIGTTTPVSTLQVKDALAFETVNTTTTTITQVAVDTFPVATFRSAKYQVQITCPGQIATLGGITTGGSGYTAGTFNVTFSNSSGNGSAAQGTLTISNGTVAQIGVTSGGSGYIAGDVLTAGGGSGLQVSVGSTAAVTGAILTLGAITSAGIGYTAGVGVGTTSLTFLGGTGTGAVGLATILDGVITSSTLLQQPTTGTGGTVYYAGSNYSTATVLTIAKTEVTNTITDIVGSVGVSTFTSLTAHGIGVSDAIRVSSTSNGLTAGTDYYVVSTPTSTTFTLGSSVGVGTTFTTGSGLAIAFYRNSAIAGGSVAYLNAITGVSTNYQVSDLMVLQDGRVADYVEYGTIANTDILGTFVADISGTNARLLLTPTYPNNTVKVVRQAITV